MAGSRLSEECATVSGICGILLALYPEVCRCRDAVGAFDREGCAVCVGHQLFSCFPGFTCVTSRRPDSGLSNRDWTIHSGYRRQQFWTRGCVEPDPGRPGAGGGVL